ncbi:hypothetical protein DFA_06813 [Cavenderia fasciculata]|uniref:Uncharacterized protein n=1 Tax=Cavenderia fasciculata TaxID=261658 RepID=F4Q2C6_CACFS|nr:uncharacterized protein DFA_06813 [Cavenderia fasciculata]EGG18146.1 hypothetical protein DFA_06813 [Cavenderia fasciculata]|eukprot:XP_004366187.1 hypothetical protein DFA_06813 [Cavenderia fasciculata]
MKSFLESLPKIIKKQILQEIIFDVTKHNTHQNNNNNSEGEDDDNNNQQHQQQQINIINLIITLSMVCKSWLGIIPSLFYPYLHVDSLHQLRQLIHLSQVGVLLNHHSCIQFNQITIHLQQDNNEDSLNNNNNSSTNELMKEFLNGLRGCRCLKVHASNSEDDMLKDVVTLNHSVRDLQLIGRLPLVEYTHIPKELLHNSHIKSLTIKNGLTDLNGQLVLESLITQDDQQVKVDNSTTTTLQQNNNNNNNNMLDLKYLGLIDNQCDGATIKILSKIMAVNHKMEMI